MRSFSYPDSDNSPGNTHLIHKEVSHRGSATCPLCPGSCPGRCQLESGNVISASIGLAFSTILGEDWLCGVAGENVLSHSVGHTDGSVRFT